MAWAALMSLAALLLLVLVAGCSGNPPVAPTVPVTGAGPSTAPAALGEAAEPGLRIYVFRGGRAGTLGHNHVLLAPSLKVDWPDAGPVLYFRLDDLVLDPAALRESLGPAFASRLDEAAVAATRANMLKSLEAQAYPDVTVTTLKQVGEGPRRAVEVEIALHGQRRRQWLAVEVQGRRAHGRVVVRQSDFGIQPFSVLGGLLAVQDELVVDFSIEQP